MQHEEWFVIGFREALTELKRDSSPTMKSILDRLKDAQSTYQAHVHVAETLLEPKIQFGFSLQWQPSDGWTVVHEKNVHVVPIEYALDVIKKKGVLSMDDFLDGTI